MRSLEQSREIAHSTYIPHDRSHQEATYRLVVCGPAGYCCCSSGNPAYVAISEVDCYQSTYCPASDLIKRQPAVSLCVIPPATIVARAETLPLSLFLKLIAIKADTVPRRCDAPDGHL